MESKMKQPARRGAPAGQRGRKTVKSRNRDLVRTYPRTQFVDKLRRLADAIESAQAFTIQVAGERLRIPADVAFNIEHERSGRSQELEFQVLWTDR
jgi:amphi-Trp domain-containing protein